MVKIFMSVRNRLAITKKAIEALILHSEIPHRLYVYDNATNYRLKDHFDFFHELYNTNLLSGKFRFPVDRSRFVPVKAEIKIKVSL